MPLQGEAKTVYQREYMRRRRAGLRTRMSKSNHCSFCGEPASQERILIAGERVRICEFCVAEAAALIAEQRVD
jgi:formylmethanofuran dehydrogenase subunit E